MSTTRSMLRVRLHRLHNRADLMGSEEFAAEALPLIFESCEVVGCAEDLILQRADGLEDIFEDNLLRLGKAIGVEVDDDHD